MKLPTLKAVMFYHEIVLALG